MQDFLEHNIDYAGISDAYKMALKALDLGDVLQNVKQEISTIPLTDGDGHNGHWFRAPQAIIKDVNAIIDKFINEVEQ